MGKQTFGWNMMKFIIFTLFGISTIFGAEKKDQKMTEKLIQIEIITEEQSKDLERLVNKFLILRKLKHDDIFDIKYQRCGIHKSAMIIYQIDFEEKKQ